MTSKGNYFSLLLSCLYGVWFSRCGAHIYHIGGVFPNNESGGYFTRLVQELNDESTGNGGDSFVTHVITTSSNPVNVSDELCAKIISHSVNAIVISAPENQMTMTILSQRNSQYKIPAIVIPNSDNKIRHYRANLDDNLFLSTIPPYSRQASIWAQYIKEFYSDAKKIFIVQSSSDENLALINAFSYALKYQADIHISEIYLKFSPGTLTNDMIESLVTDIRSSGIGIIILIENYLKFSPGTLTNDMIESLVTDIRSSGIGIIVLIATSAAEAEAVFSFAAENDNITAIPQNLWLLSENAFSASSIPTNVAAAIPIMTEELAYIRDATHWLVSALRGISDLPDYSPPPTKCGKKWNFGQLLLDRMLKHRLENRTTGKVAFDYDKLNGYTTYKMMVIQNDGNRMEIGRYYYEGKNHERNITFVPNKLVVPEKFHGKNYGKPHIKVVTIREVPFLETRKPEIILKRRKVGNSSEKICKERELYCPLVSASNKSVSEYCCSGYCVDLLKKIAERLNFSYEMYLSPDNRFGDYQFRNNATNTKTWNGLMGEVVYGRADMIVAPFTINAERAEFIDFSKPFKYQGLTILEKMPSQASGLVSFLQPFSNNLWILVMVSVHVVALVLYLLDHFSPFSRYKIPGSTVTEQDGLNLSSAIWFSWSVLLNSGIGEGMPRSFSGKMMGIMWAGFAMVIVASYTANLAAFLVLERPKSKLTGIWDARLRHSTGNFSCATVKGSAVEMYFRRQVELSSMYNSMKLVSSAEEGIASVRDGRLNVFIWDNSRLDYEASRDCNLVTAGKLFARSGFGVGLRKNSPHTDAVTSAILDFHENGFLENLDKVWIARGKNKCYSSEKSPNMLGLKNMAGVFTLVVAGIVGGAGLVTIEIMYKKRQIVKQKRMELARHAAIKWRIMTIQRRTLRNGGFTLYNGRRRHKCNESHPLKTISFSMENLNSETE